jgi:YesN/AraC family two-component response regulator
MEDSYDDALVGEMVRYMRERIGESVTIKDLCHRFSYGKTHLCARFSAATGKSINRYFTELKITAAKQIIREKNASGELFARIAEMLGFSSPSYFYSTFKKITGMTPSEYFKSVHQYEKD